MQKIKRTYEIAEYSINNDKKVVITIKSKLSWFSAIAYMLFLVLLYYWMIPIIKDCSFSISEVVFILLVVIANCFYAAGILWMFLGTERLVLWKEKIYYSKNLFQIAFDKKNFVFSKAENWNVNADYPLSFCSTNIFTHRIAFNLAGGKIIFKHFNKVNRFADNVSEDEAQIILQKIFEYFATPSH